MFAELIERIGTILQARKIPYMIIGGQAVLLYGEPRLTRDIDITLGIDTERLPDILALARELDLRPLPDDVSTFVEQTMVLPTADDGSGIRVDFIFSFSSYERQAIDRARRVPFGNIDVAFAAPEDVIVHKIFAGRPRDLEDVRTIILKIPDIDREYVRQWLGEFDATLDNGGFVDRFEELLR